MLKAWCSYCIYHQIYPNIGKKANTFSIWVSGCTTRVKIPQNDRASLVEGNDSLREHVHRTGMNTLESESESLEDQLPFGLVYVHGVFSFKDCKTLTNNG